MIKRNKIRPLLNKDLIMCLFTRFFERRYVFSSVLSLKNGELLIGYSDQAIRLEAPEVHLLCEDQSVHRD